MKIRLADGTAVPLKGWAPWTSTGDTEEKVLVIIEQGSTFLSKDEFAERLVEEE